MTHFRDVGQIVLVLHIVMCSAGMIFSVRSLTDRESYGWFFDINPVSLRVSIAGWEIEGCLVERLVTHRWPLDVRPFGCRLGFSELPRSTMPDPDPTVLKP